MALGSWRTMAENERLTMARAGDRLFILWPAEAKRTGSVALAKGGLSTNPFWVRDLIVILGKVGHVLVSKL